MSRGHVVSKYVRRGVGTGRVQDPGAGADLSKGEALVASGVACFDSFQENAYRLFFAFEDNYASTSPQHLFTIMPSGVIENDAMLKPNKGKGLLAYGYTQSIDPSKVESLKKTYGASIDPFIHRRDDGSFGIVQTWTTNYNQEWKKKFCEHQTNPSPENFQDLAVKDFHAAMVKLFGEKARSQQVTFVVSSGRNDKPVYVGLGKQLMQLLRSCSEVRLGLGIIKLLDDGFVTRIKCEGKEDGEKPFHMDLDQDYAIYTKQGNATMACCKPMDQFNRENVIERAVCQQPTEEDQSRVRPLKQKLAMSTFAGLRKVTTYQRPPHDHGCKPVEILPGLWTAHFHDIENTESLMKVCPGAKTVINTATDKCPTRAGSYGSDIAVLVVEDLLDDPDPRKKVDSMPEGPEKVAAKAALPTFQASECAGNAKKDFERVNKAIDDTMAVGGITMIHCYASLSRSVAFVLAYMMKTENITLVEAAKRMKRKWDATWPNDTFVEQLLEYEKELGLGGEPGVMEMKVTTKKSVRFYTNAVKNFFQGRRGQRW